MSSRQLNEKTSENRGHQLAHKAHISSAELDKQDYDFRESTGIVCEMCKSDDVEQRQIMDLWNTDIGKLGIYHHV